MRDVAFLTRLRPAPWLVTLALLVGAGCSGGGSSTTPQFDDPEITEIIKNTKDPKQRRDLIKAAILRRGDPEAVPRPSPKSAKSKTARKR